MPWPREPKREELGIGVKGGNCTYDEKAKEKRDNELRSVKGLQKDIVETKVTHTDVQKPGKHSS